MRIAQERDKSFEYAVQWQEMVEVASVCRCPTTFNDIFLSMNENFLILFVIKAQVEMNFYFAIINYHQ